MSWNTQPNCRASENWRFDEFRPNFLSLLLTGFPVRSWQASETDSLSFQFPFFKHRHSTFVIIRFGPFRRLFINLTMCKWALFPKTATTLVFVEQAFWRVPFFTKWVTASSSKVILARPSRRSTTGLLPLGLLVLDDFRSFCCMKEFGDICDCVIFPRLLTSWRRLQVSPVIHCPLDSHCQQFPGILCTRCFVPWFLTTAFFSKFHFWPQNSYFEFPARYFFSP